MLPPVLEIYVLWHPADEGGPAAAEQFVEHFHGALFSGLIGGAVEVYMRSEGWRSANDAPRPIPLLGSSAPNEVANAQVTAVVPILGVSLARAVESGTEWYGYTSALADAALAHPHKVIVLPLSLDRAASKGTKLGHIFNRFQRIAEASAVHEPEAGLRCRDLAQSIVQVLGQERLTVFISHAKQSERNKNDDVLQLVDKVRWVIGQTRLSDFFDANDLQPGRDWDAALRTQAATSALLAIRTDLYAGREWCQREMLIAKRAGMSVVVLDALERGEERGSFLMDHVPRIPVRKDDNRWRDDDVWTGLNLLVDECLKRELWKKQAELAKDRPELHVAWWAPHAPEPATLSRWLADARDKGWAPSSDKIRILHPDPPLGPEEYSVLDEIAQLNGIPGVDAMTPRLLAARGG